jgi:3-oxoacyl-[acyl-carrier-protein] synthase II
MEKRRVVITGMGVVAPNGIGVDNFWDSLVHGRSGVRRITHFDASSYPCQVAGEVDQFNPYNFMSSKNAKRATRYAQFALVAAISAVEDSGLSTKELETRNAGIFIANSIGGVDLLEQQLFILHEKGLRRLNPATAALAYPQSAASLLAVEFRIKGPTMTIATGCPGGIQAIDMATLLIRKGEIDIAIVGGTETPITPFTVAAFCASKGLSEANGAPECASRPFDRTRSGYILSEGAGVVILEGLERALSRSPRVYGEILGCSSTNDGYSIFDIDPSGDGLYRAMKNALKEANISPAEVDYISAHAPSIVLTDKVETAAIKKIFGELAYQVPVSSIKSMIGQPLAAAGIFQLISCLLGFRDQIIPPTINYEFPDPDCDLDYVPNRARRSELKVNLINTHGFGGINASAVVGMIEDNLR